MYLFDEWDVKFMINEINIIEVKKDINRNSLKLLLKKIKSKVN